MEVEKESHSRRRPSRELGLIEKNKVELLALEQLGYRAVKNRANGMTPLSLFACTLHFSLKISVLLNFCKIWGTTTTSVCDKVVNRLLTTGYGMV